MHPETPPLLSFARIAGKSPRRFCIVSALFLLLLLAPAPPCAAGEYAGEARPPKWTTIPAILDAARSVLANPDAPKTNITTRDLGLAIVNDPAKVAEVLAGLSALHTPEADTLRAELIMVLAEGDSFYVSSKSNPQPPKEVSSEQLSAYAYELFDNPDPMIRAMGEWALAIRFGRDYEGSNRVWPTPGQEPAFMKRWLAIPATEFRDLDYCRQLVSTGEHRTAASILKNAQLVRTRVDGITGYIKSKFPEAGGAQEPRAQAVRSAVAKLETAASTKAPLADLRRQWLEVRRVAHTAVMANPDIDFDTVVYATRPMGDNGDITWGHTRDKYAPGGDILVKKGLDPTTPGRALIGGRLGPGHIRGLDLWWEADRVAFSFLKQPKGQGDEQWAHLYEMNIDGSGLRQITDSRSQMDIEPSYLPGGKFAFITDRSNFGSQCAGSFPQDNKYVQLYTCDKEGENIRAISNNKDIDRYPHVMEDGSIIFTHWEYQERHLWQTHSIWTCRPDGGMMDALYKAHIEDGPMSLREARQIPGERKLVAIAAGHHNFEYGAVMLVDLDRGVNDQSCMRLVNLAKSGEPGDGLSVTEGGFGKGVRLVDEGGTREGGGQYSFPYPLSAKSFLASFTYKRPEVVSQEAKANFTYGRDSGLYYIDVWGNKELIQRERSISVHWLMPVKKRPVPPVIPERAETGNFAVVSVQNVYAELPKEKFGEIKYLRVSQHVPWPCPVNEAKWSGYDDYKGIPSGAFHNVFGFWDWSPARAIGIVPVEPDGSAHFKVPASQPVYFQALDKDFTEVRRQRSLVSLAPGETRSCIGCHETKDHTAASLAPGTTLALRRPPSTPKPPSWGAVDLPDFRRNIQPIFDKHCLSCHNATQPDGGVDLSSDVVEDYAQSYRTLFGLKRSDPTPWGGYSYEIWHTKQDAARRKAENVKDSVTDEVFKNMRTGKQPGQLVSISDRLGNSEITQPRQFGSGQSRLVRTMLDEPKHREIKAKMSETEWIDLLTWIDLNAAYSDTFAYPDPAKNQNGISGHRARLQLADPWKRPSAGNWTWSDKEPDLIVLEDPVPNAPALLWIGSDQSTYHDLPYQVSRWLRPLQPFSGMTSNAIGHHQKTVESYLEPEFTADFGLRYGRPLLDQIRRDRATYLVVEVPLDAFAAKPDAMNRALDQIAAAVASYGGKIFLFECGKADAATLDRGLALNKEAATRIHARVIPGAVAARALAAAKGDAAAWDAVEPKVPGANLAYIYLNLAYAALSGKPVQDCATSFRAAAYVPTDGINQRYGGRRRLSTPLVTLSPPDSSTLKALATEALARQ